MRRWLLWLRWVVMLWNCRCLSLLVLSLRAGLWGAAVGSLYAP
jgi:hypothetical protein